MFFGIDRLFDNKNKEIEIDEMSTDDKIGYEDFERLFPSPLEKRFDTQGNVLRQLKELNTEMNPEHQDFRGWDWVQERFGIGVAGEYVDKWKEAKKDFARKYEKWASDDTYKGAEGRYDRPRKDIEADLLIGKPEIKESKKDLSMWQKIGKHFSENADARDKLFTTLGSMGRELVKPVQPGQAAAGALLPTLSRGMEAGEEAYAAKEAAETKRILDIASARQKINPMQYYSNKMQEARTMVPEGTDPDSALGIQWIGNYLRNQGIPGQVLDLQTALTEAQISLTTVSEEERPNIQKNINAYISQINTLLNQSLGSGGSTDSNTVPYLG
jgi:hypothetical protein